MNERTGQGNPMGEIMAVSYSRPKYTFTFPESSRIAGDPVSVTLVPVTMEEENTANKTAKALGSEPNNELIKHSLVALDGASVTWENDGKASALNRCSPKVRELIGYAFGTIHIPKKIEVDSFLASLDVNV
jgi:hypothetical protein